MSKSAFKKIVSIATNVVLYFFLALCIFSVIFTVFSKKDSDGAATILGFQMRLVITESMEESEFTDVSDFDIGSLPVGSMIFIDCVPEDEAKALEWYSELEVGDVLTFKFAYTTQVTITHRITKITPKYDIADEDKDGVKDEVVGYIFELEGDNKAYENQTLLKQTIDTTVDESLNYVIGKVTAKSVFLGFIINLLKEPAGIIFVVIVPCIIIIFLEVIKLINAFSQEKKKQRDKEDEVKNSEIEELKRKLLELERLSMQSSAPPPVTENKEEPKTDTPDPAESAPNTDLTDGISKQ